MTARPHADHTWTIASGQTESNEIDVTEHPLAVMVFTATPTGTTFTFKVRTPTMESNSVAAQTMQGSDYLISVSAAGAYHIPPEVCAAGKVTLVSGSSEVAARTIYVGTS